ncbi:MAG TPA: DUF3883 domain-containing protein, partial [Lacipirellulaceae bacterium]|nr:DUF3883 domain-containing protein [Lacipirellulaceae bacterium]
MSALYPEGPAEQLVAIESSKKSSGQGLGASAVARRAVEIRAMEVAREHLASQWNEIKDVSLHEPFDFHCRDDHRELHVEVKGTTQNGSVILLTPNEVEHARSHSDSTALIVVS